MGKWYIGIAWGASTLVACSSHDLIGSKTERVDAAAQEVTAPACNQPQAVLSCWLPGTCHYSNCGGWGWPGGVMHFELGAGFSFQDRMTILNAAAAWNQAINGFSLSECVNDDCLSQLGSGQRWYHIDLSGPAYPCGVDSGISGPGSATGPQYGSMGPSGVTGLITNWVASHNFGHALGMPHTFIRNDRDRYVTMSSSYFCGPNKQPPGYCAYAPQDVPQDPRFATGQFGVYDELSVMNYISNDICENAGIEPDCDALPTAADGSGMLEFYRSYSGWVPFQNLGADVDPSQPLSGALAPGVTVAGSSGDWSTPAASSWGWPLLDIFVLGTDGHIYDKYKSVPNSVFAGWSSWVDLGGTFTTAPSATSWAYGRTDVVAVGTDQQVHIRTYANGQWYPWASLPYLAGGALSAPAITTWGWGRLDVFVRGTGNQLYQSTFTTSTGWQAWAQRGNGTFTGNPSAAAGMWSGVGRIDVVVAGADNPPTMWWIFSNDGTGYNWIGYNKLGTGTIWPGSSPAIASWGSGRLDVFFRSGNSTLWQQACVGSCTAASAWTGYFALGGILKSSPGAHATSNYKQEIDVLGINEDHQQPGVWWKYWPDTDLRNHYVNPPGYCPPP